jgi:protein subunit release factor A
VTLHNLPTFLEGDMDGLIEPLMANDLQQRLAALNL